MADCENIAKHHQHPVFVIKYSDRLCFRIESFASSAIKGISACAPPIASGGLPKSLEALASEAFELTSQVDWPKKV